MKTVHIEFISDFICPWCYLGKARLARVKTALMDEIQLDIELKPYMLYPHIPKGGLPKADFAKNTKPGMGRSLKYEAEIEGLHINYRNIEHIPYSFEAHRLVSLVEDSKEQYQLAKKLFEDYFEWGQDLENADYLVQQGRAAGLHESMLTDFLTTDLGASQVANAIKQNQAAFINVVPSLRFQKKILLPGLQPSEVWINYIRRAAQLPVT